MRSSSPGDESSRPSDRVFGWGFDLAIVAFSVIALVSVMDDRARPSASDLAAADRGTGIELSRACPQDDGQPVAVIPVSLGAEPAACQSPRPGPAR